MKWKKPIVLAFLVLSISAMAADASKDTSKDGSKDASKKKDVKDLNLDSLQKTVVNSPKFLTTSLNQDKINTELQKNEDKFQDESLNRIEQMQACSKLANRNQVEECQKNISKNKK